MVGKMLGNRYEILEKIGEGGMSIVYRAQCHILNRIVAVKVLKEEYSNDEEFLRKFKNEALSVAKLNHANIINVFDVGQDGEISYIVMEYVEGKNLKEVLRFQRKFPTSKVLDIARQIAMALEEAHQKKIVHRDIKAQNIMLTFKGVVKVGDFGIAKAVSNSTVTASGAIMGSVHYFSPEQARGGYIDERSDLYSLGIIMYEMATGRLPFDGDSPVNIALKHIQDPLRFWDTDEISSDCKDMIIKLTQKNPDRRYASASALIKDIDRLQRGNKNVISVSEEEEFATKAVPIPDRVSRQPLQRRSILERREEEEFESTSAEKKSNALLTFLAVFLGIFVIGIVGIWFLVNGATLGSQKEEIVTIPPIVGKSEEEARAELINLGLQLNVKGSEQNGKYAPGLITDSDPDEGIKVEKGSIVNVILSEERKETLKLEDFKGKKFEEIEAKYRGKLVFHTEYITSVEPTDTVLKQQPEVGETVDVGSEVILFLSKNMDDIPVPLPGVVGKDPEQARTILSGFKVSESYKEDLKKPEGIVLSQNPSEGTQVKPKSAVSIVINKYEKPKTVKQRIPVTLPQDVETVHVKITEDGSGKVIYDSMVDTLEMEGVLTVDVEAPAGENLTYTIEIDGAYYENVAITF